MKYLAAVAPRHVIGPLRHGPDVKFAGPQPPAWRDLFLEAYGMALDGVSDRRAVRTLVNSAAGDRLSLETARDHFIGLLAEEWEPSVARARHYLDAALEYGDGRGSWGTLARAF